jgi:hypothetical protein
MVEDRAPFGLLIATLGAAVLAISVFLPWYGLSITQAGATATHQQLVSAARQYGNTTLQAKANIAGERFNSFVGHRFASVSAHQSLKHVSLILVVLAGVALLASLLRFANLRGLLFATGGQIALLGVLAVVVVAFRTLRPPGAAGELISLSPTWGIWLALVSAAAVVGGALLAGVSQTHPRTRPKVGPGPPPLGRDVARPAAAFRERR